LKPVTAFDPLGRDLAQEPVLAGNTGTVHART